MGGETRNRSGVKITALVLIALLLAVWTVYSGFRPYAPILSERLFVSQTVGMKPRIGLGDKVWTKATIGERVKPGDIVLVKPTEALANMMSLPPDTKTEFLRRVAVIGPATIRASGGTVYVNGTAIDEPYLAPKTVNDDFGPVDVPKNFLFLMADNRSQSLDDRYSGPTPFANVRYKVTAVFDPLLG